MQNNMAHNHLKRLIENKQTPKDDTFITHPSLAKGYQPIEKYEEKLDKCISVLNELPSKLITEAYQYYLDADKLKDYTNLKVGSMFITGPVHSGKTIFLVAQYAKALIISASYPLSKVRIIYNEYAEIIKEFKSAIEYEDVSEIGLYNKYKTADVLLIDDLFTGGMNTEYAMNIIYTIIDYRHLHYLPTLVTTNLTEEDISLLDNGDRLLRRLMEHAEILPFMTKE